MSAADRLGPLAASAYWLRTWPRRYGLMVVTVCIAAAAQRLAEQAMGFSHSFLLLYPAIVIVSVGAGFLPGVVATLLCAAAAAFLTDPRRLFSLSSGIDSLDLILFVCVGIAVSWLADSLRRGEQGHRLLVQNLSSALVVYAPDTRILFANELACRMLDLTTDQLKGAPVNRQGGYFVREDGTPLPVEESPVNRVLASRTKISFTAGIEHPGRTERIWVLVTAYPELDGPRLRQIVVNLLDITDRKRSEEALRRSEQRMRLFIEHAPVGAALFDRQMRYVQASRRWCHDYGLGDRDIIGLSHYDLFPEIPERWKEAHRRCLAGEVLREEHDPFVRPDGSVQWVRWELHPWYEQGEIGGVAIFAEDVTARERAAEALRRSEQRYRLLFEKNLAGVAIADIDGKMFECNEAWAQMLGYDSPGELRDSPATELYYDQSEREPLLRELKERGAFLSRELRLRKKDGRAVWVLFDCILRPSEGGVPIMQTTAIDITEKKEAEEALRGSELRYRTLFEKTVAAVGILSMNGSVIDCNDAWAHLFGHQTAADCRGRQVQNCYRDAGQRDFLVRELERTGVFLNHEWEMRREDGSPVWVLLNSVLVPQPDGEPVIQSTMVDITERKLAQEKVRHSEECFRVALKDSPITVFTQDRSLRYTWLYNPQMHWQGEALGKTDDEILGTRKAATFNGLKQRVLDSRAGLREEVAVPAGGTSQVFDVTIEPLFDTQNNVTGITAACMNIARLHEMADRLQESRDRLANEKSYLQSEIQTELGFEEIVGKSAALREVLRKARIVAPTDSTVLLLGETGTGKELVARSVHALSERRNNTFVKLNCAAVPSGLLESELFGHEKGAFTGAISQKVGRLELADKGTLFLDEIGELPLELQPKLLRVLQDREFERLGGIKTVRVDVRIIAATNRDLQQDIAEKRFREDLFYRLNVFPIELPALRERREDIPGLVNHFVRKHAARMGKRIDAIPEESMSALRRWSWPGNIRELENMIERMVIMSRGVVLAMPPAEISDSGGATDDHLIGIEREHIVRVLRETNGVLSGREGAASRLGLKRTTLQSMIKRLGIQPREYRSGSNGTFGRL